MIAHGLDTSFLVVLEVSRHALHRRVRSQCDKLLTSEDRLALPPQVLAEFIHVVNGRLLDALLAASSPSVELTLRCMAASVPSSPPIN